MSQSFHFSWTASCTSGNCKKQNFPYFYLPSYFLLFYVSSFACFFLTSTCISFICLSLFLFYVCLLISCCSKLAFFQFNFKTTSLRLTKKIIFFFHISVLSFFVPFSLHPSLTFYLIPSDYLR